MLSHVVSQARLRPAGLHQAEGRTPQIS